MRTEDVRDLVDELGEKVLKLEEGVAEMSHFHTVKPAEVDKSYAHKSTPMGPHTAARAPITQVTPEKTSGDEEMTDADTAEITGEKTFSKMNVKPGVASKHVVSPEAEAKPPAIKKTYTAAELQQMVAARVPNLAFK